RLPRRQLLRCPAPPTRRGRHRAELGALRAGTAGHLYRPEQKARVATWLQIVASGGCSAVYHAFQNPTPAGFLPSFVLFSVHAGLYVLGRRSLTPVVITHSIYHVFGEPYLLMLALAAMHR